MSRQAALQASDGAGQTPHPQHTALLIVLLGQDAGAFLHVAYQPLLRVGQNQHILHHRRLEEADDGLAQRADIAWRMGGKHDGVGYFSSNAARPAASTLSILLSTRRARHPIVSRSTAPRRVTENCPSSGAVPEERR